MSEDIPLADLAPRAKSATPEPSDTEAMHKPRFRKPTITASSSTGNLNTLATSVAAREHHSHKYKSSEDLGHQGSFESLLLATDMATIMEELEETAPGEPPGRNGYQPLGHSEPIWHRRMLVLPLTLFIAMGVTALVISTIAWARDRETNNAKVDPSLFPADRHGLLDTQYMVRLVHFNDVHARFLPHDSKGNDCDPLSVSDCVGGSAYMRTLVDQLRGARDVDHAVVLNAGDELQGSIYATLFTGNMSAAILNTFHLDALALGNHEFDRGTDHLARYLAKVTAPAVCANLEFTKDVPQLQMMVQPFTVVDRHKLGVIGVLTQETMASSMVDNGARITDPLRAVNGAVKRLNQMGILRIVVLSHLGYEMDQELASNVDAGVSLIVGAHTHSYLAPPQSDPLAQRAEDSKGTYPTWVTNHNDSEWQTAVVQAKSYGEYVGYLDLVFNTDGSLDSKLTRGKPVAVDFASKESPLRGLEPNKQVEKIMQPFIHKAQELTRQKIGMATQEFTRPTGNRDPEELALGNLIADAMVWADKKLKVAMLGTGALRGALPKGAITKGGLFTVLPYDDSLVAAQLTGAQILDVVRRGLSANNNQSSAVLSTLQVSGLRWTQNDQVEIRTKVGVVDARPMQEETWETVADASMYEVLMPGFLARGGDNLVQSVSSVRVVNSGYRDLVELYITKFSPIAPVLDHRK